MNRMRPPPERGFSLIETMMGLVILGFGLLALARLQTVLLENSSHAKQRTEATRLAQEKLEQLRAFQQLASATNRFAYADIVSAAPQTVTGIASNTTFTRSWTVTPSAEPNYRSVDVLVSWTDLKGQVQQVKLSSVIAGLDPQVSGSLVVPPVGSPVKRPRNRALNIPIPAVSVSPTRSAFVPPGASDYYLVFDNDTGLVTARCTGAIADYSENACPDALQAYLVSGYIRFSTGNNNPSASNPTSERMPLTVSTVRTENGGVPPADECSNDSQQATPAYARTVVYTCLVYPFDHDGNAATTRVWSGRLELALIGQAIGTGSTQYRVCRYSFDYNRNGVTDNNEHPSPYTRISSSLSNQNYLVIRGNNTCPTDSSTTNPVNYNTVQHQPAV